TTFTGGLLIIKGDNTPNSLVITQAGSNLALTVNGKPSGSFAASSLQITMGNSADVVDLRVTAALTGTVTANLGNGNDYFTTRNSTIGARIGGNVLVNTGLSTINPAGGAFEDRVELYNLIFGGQSTQAIGSAGSAFTLLDVQSADVRGTL